LIEFWFRFELDLVSFDLDFELAAAGGHYVSEEGDQRRSIFYIHEDKLSNFLTFETPRWGSDAIMNVALRLARPPDQMPGCQCCSVHRMLIRDAGAQDAARSPTAKPAEEPQKEQEATAKPAEEPQKEQEATAKPAEEPQKSHKKSHKIDTESHQKDQEPQEKDEGDGGFYDGMPSTTVTTVADHGISTAEPWFLCDGSGASSSVYVDLWAIFDDFWPWASQDCLLFSSCNRLWWFIDGPTLMPLLNLAYYWNRVSSFRAPPVPPLLVIIHGAKRVKKCMPAKSFKIANVLIQRLIRLGQTF